MKGLSSRSNDVIPGILCLSSTGRQRISEVINMDDVRLEEGNGIESEFDSPGFDTEVQRIRCPERQPGML